MIALFLHTLPLGVPLTTHTFVSSGVCMLSCHSDLCLHHVQVKVLCVSATPHSTLQPPKMPVFTVEQSYTQLQDSLFMGEIKILIIIYIFMKGIPSPTSSLHSHLPPNSKCSNAVTF